MTTQAWVFLSLVIAGLSSSITLWFAKGSTKKAREQGYFEAMRDLPSTMAAMTEEEILTLGTEVARLRAE